MDSGMVTEEVAESGRRVYRKQTERRWRRRRKRSEGRTEREDQKLEFAKRQQQQEIAEILDKDSVAGERRGICLFG